MTEFERLVEVVEDLRVQQAELAGAVRVLLDREAPREFLRTGAMCRLLGVTRGTLYAWERRGLVARGHDALGEVVWNRSEVLRVAAQQVGPNTRNASRGRSRRRPAGRRDSRSFSPVKGTDPAAAGSTSEGG